MSARVQFVANKGALKKIANSGEVQGVCLRGADSAAQQARGKSGALYVTDVRPGKFRCHARASTYRGDEKSFFTEARTRALRTSTPRI